VAVGSVAAVLAFLVFGSLTDAEDTFLLEGAARVGVGATMAEVFLEETRVGLAGSAAFAFAFVFAGATACAVATFLGGILKSL
jgi:hypothetical protein